MEIIRYVSITLHLVKILQSTIAPAFDLAKIIFDAVLAGIGSAHDRTTRGFAIIPTRGITKIIDDALYQSEIKTRDLNAQIASSWIFFGSKKTQES